MHSCQKEGGFWPLLEHHRTECGGRRLIGAELAQPVQLNTTSEHISSLALPESQQAVQASSCNPIVSTDSKCVVFLTQHCLSPTNPRVPALRGSTGQPLMEDPVWINPVLGPKGTGL